jgi:hypothetical protein
MSTVVSLRSDRGHLRGGEAAPASKRPRRRVMRVQTQRTDPLPLTWEIPTTIATVGVLAAAVALPAGQGLAFLLQGEPFTWPTGHLPQSVGGLMSGRPAQGLSSPLSQIPPTPLVYACIGVLELVLTVLVVWVTGVWWRTIGPGAQLGLASRHEVRAVLGKGSLHRRRKTIRPDLVARSRSTGRGEP